MLSGMGEMIDVIDEDVGHYEGEEDDETHQGDNDTQGDSIRLEMMGLRKVLHLGTSDGNRLDSNISHFRPVQEPHCLSSGDLSQSQLMIQKAYLCLFLLERRSIQNPDIHLA